MHTPSTVAEALALRADGLGARRIARRMGLPVETVRDWLAGRLPKHSRGGEHGAAHPSACEYCGNGRHPLGELPSKYVYLLGLYLGDGCLSTHPRGVYKLRITLDARYPGIVKSTAIAIEAVRGSIGHVQPRRGENCVEVCSYWKSWPCLFPQHGVGPKHARQIVLTDWQLQLVERWPDQLIKGLIHSDGCRFQNTGRNNWSFPRYSFSQKSDDIRSIFCSACDLMNIHWTRSGESIIYISRKADVERLDTFIGPTR